MSATTWHEESVSDACLKAVILYDDWKLAAQTSAMLGGVALRADEAWRWNVSPWRIDLLSDSVAAKAAHREAQAAHLMLIVTRDAVAISPAVLAWLESWARGREVPEAALAVFDGTEIEAIPASPSPPLAAFVRKHGLSVIAGDVRAMHDPPLKQNLKDAARSPAK